MLQMRRCVCPELNSLCSHTLQVNILDDSVYVYPIKDIQHGRAVEQLLKERFPEIESGETGTLLVILLSFFNVAQFSTCAPLNSGSAYSAPTPLTHVPSLPTFAPLTYASPPPV